MQRLLGTWWVVALLALALFGCEKPSGGGAGEGAPAGKPRVVVTTTMLASAVAEIGGDAVEIQAIMKPGGDPHLYTPTPSDARRVARSQLVITSGLHLEGWIDDLVRNAGGERPVVVASEGIEPISMKDSPGGVDPHFWFDLKAWQVASDNITAALVDVVGADSEQARAIEARAASYKEKITALDAWTRARVGTIPEEQRVLITSHDAFNYFGRAYGVDVVGIQGISTEQEASQRDVANTIELVRKRKAPAIFVESSVNPALIKQVSRETGVEVAGPLYSDSTGPVGGPAESFVGMFTENVRQITEGLGGTHEPFEPGS